jgi:UDP-2-acetamido-3-amino-2,3-dideoxy-glucuronate N-acetyltransferase
MAGNVAVVGGGYWGKNLVRNFAELGALHTICDVDTKALADFKTQYPTVNTETDFTRVLQNKAIAGVVIATPAAMHYQMAKQALQAGKDTFVEKPLALEVEEGKKLVVLAEKNGKILMVGHLLEVYRPLGHKAGAFSESERAAEKVLSLPIYPELEDKHVEFITDQIKEYFKQ